MPEQTSQEPWTGRRRMLLGIAAVAGGFAAMRATRTVEATEGTMRFGDTNNAGTDGTILISAESSTDGTLRLRNTINGGVGLSVSSDGTGIYIDAEEIGTVSLGSNLGLQGEAVGTGGVGVLGDAPFGSGGIGVHGTAGSGVGVRGESGSRAQGTTARAGVLGYASSAFGVVGEGNGKTGVLGTSSKTSSVTAARSGVGVHGIGSAIGVLATAATGAVALRAEAPAGGVAFQAVGPVELDGSLDLPSLTARDGLLAEGGGATAIRGYSDAAAGDLVAQGIGVLGVGTTIGVLARGRTGATALKAIAPTSGRALDVVGPTTLNGPTEVLAGLNVTGALTIGGGAGIEGVTKLEGDTTIAGDLSVGGAITGTFPPNLARRDLPNTFTKQTTMRRRLRLRGGLSTRSAGQVLLAKDAKTVDVNLPAGVTVGVKAAIVVTPLGEPFNGTFFVSRIGPRKIRIRSLDPAPRAVVLAWAAFN